MKALLVMPEVQRRSMGGNLHTHAVQSLLMEGATPGREGGGGGWAGRCHEAGRREQVGLFWET